ncbi:Pectinacetylesterase family protein [Pelomyxa schiedti]|nr:Pectinacetylesterase family protein [Pelomyxa schiedti]
MRPTVRSFGCGVIVIAVIAVVSGTQLNLVLLDDSDVTGAVCLDGTSAGYYIRLATSQSAVNKWQIYFQGGGWCYEEADCASRSTTTLGSSSAWESSVWVGGHMSDDPNINPDFYDWNFVFLPYCDGASFAGYKANPVIYNDVKLYFRGQVIIDEIIRHLTRDYGFGSAENVLLTGCSAGGLSTYLHADYIGTKLPSSVVKYRSMPEGGFFLDHTNLDGVAVYGEQMEYVFNMQNCTAGVDQDCIAAFPGEEWRCIFAANNYAYTSTPTFIINSAVDSWQMACILLSSPMPPESPYNGYCGTYADWTDCQNDLQKCNISQIEVMNQYSDTFTSTMKSISTFNKAGNGAFVESCYSHCIEDDDTIYTTLSIDKTTLQEAVSSWWASSSAPASAHIYSPCKYNLVGLHVECNPTCPDW